MNSTDVAALRHAFLNFCKTKIWTNPQAVTLTLKVARRIDSGGWLRLSQTAAQQNLSHFLNVLRKGLWRRGFLEEPELQCIPIYEGCQDVRPHIHLVLDKPDGIGQEHYTALIHQEWSRTHWGHQLVTVEPCHNEEGWLTYIAKARTKADYGDAIDWMNFR